MNLIKQGLTTVLGALLLVGCSQGGKNAAPKEPTAFSLMDEGNKYIGEQSKDKVVQIRAEKSIGSTTPNVWYVVYYDPTATLKAVEVKFGAGKMLTVQRPIRLLEPLFGKSEPLDRSKLKIDSDEAIRIALKEPLLANLKVTATAPKLEASNSGPVWKVKIWAQKLRDPSQDVDIGNVVLSAETGSVTLPDLNVNRVD